MATTDSTISAITGALSPQRVDVPETSTSASSKTFEKLQEEIGQLRYDIDVAAKRLEKIDTGRKKAEANRGEAMKGHTEIHAFMQQVTELQKQAESATKTDPNQTMKTFDKAKKNNIKILSDLTNKLNKVTKHLEKATGPISTAESAPANASNDKENAKSIAELVKTPITLQHESSNGESDESDSESVSRPTGQKIDRSANQKTVVDDVSTDEDDDNRSVSDRDHTKEKAPFPKPRAAMKKPENDSDDESDESVRGVAKILTTPVAPLSKQTEASQKKREQPLVRKSDDHGVISNMVKNVPIGPPSSRTAQQSDDESTDDESESDDDDNDVKDQKDMLDALETVDNKRKQIARDNSQGRPPSGSQKPKDVNPHKTEQTIPTSHKDKSRTGTKSPAPPSSAKLPPAAPKGKRIEESDEDSYFEEDQEDQEDDDDDVDDDDERRVSRKQSEHNDPDSEHDYDGEEEDAAKLIVNRRVQELRTNKYPPGTKLIVTHDFDAVQADDLTLRTGDVLVLIEQRPDDWWLCKNVQTEQEGQVPINHIQLLSKERARRRANVNTSATTLVNAFKSNNNIVAGFIPSDLSALAEFEEYQLWRALVPKMTESNLAFADLHWRVENDRIQPREVTYQKILTIKECVKIPRVKGEQINVLDRSVRVCIYDGYEIVSNIHTLRAHVPRKIDEKALTEDWHFLPNNVDTLTDEQSQLLIRTNQSTSSQNLALLFELSLWCQSTITLEKCEIGCGWAMVPLDTKPPLVSDTKSFNELLNGGHIDELNVPLDPQYKILSSNGLSGFIDRFKRARIKFSIESRENDIDILYDNLPLQPLVVPLNLVKTIVFYRNELAYQLHKRYHPTGLSTTPVYSIFLSTFFQTLSQPDLIYSLRRLYRSRRRRFLSLSATVQQQREEFIRTYELYIYPLLNYRQLPPYEFHDLTALNERRKLIQEMIRRQLSNKKSEPHDILSILLDPTLTDKWTPFTTDEISFSLQRYVPEYPVDNYVA